MADHRDPTAAAAIIAAGLQRGGGPLDEHESKRLLSAYGIPVAREAPAPDPDAAARAAQALGFPVVLKALGPRLAHKTEVAGVALDLRSAAEVVAAGRRLLGIPGAEALLVQELVAGDRELVCGLTRPPGFGACVMFGVGGIFAEAAADVAFRIAPVTEDEARGMTGGIRHAGLLGPFRGQAPADTAQLARVLVALGEIGEHHPAVAQIDVNPIKVRPDGSLSAVDALVVLAEPEDEPSPPSGPRPAAAESLAPFFSPDSVAIVGASATPGKPGHEVLRNILANGYAGRLYPVNPQGGTILGLPVHPSVADLPEAPDLAVIIVPARLCPQALRDCAARGIGHAVISAGGFAEYDEGGARIQDELTAVIREHGIRVIGPNTAGHTSTPHRFTSGFFPLGRIRPGPVTYITQTGNFCTHTMKRILTAEHFGVARVVGLGNAIDVDESDALEYAVADPHTGAIVMYLESLHRPRRFLEVAAAARGRKPIVALKSGSSDAGSRAALAHTAALAAEDRVVDGLLRQAGITRLATYGQLITAGKVLAASPLPRGNRVAFLAPSGAMLVTLTDLCGRLGLDVPDLEGRTVRRLEEISPPYIRMRNPVDIWASAWARGIHFAYREGMRALLEDDRIDAVVPILLLTRDTGLPPYDFILDLAAEFPRKPILVTFTGEQDAIAECRAYLEPRGIPTFLEIEEPFEALDILVRCRAATTLASRPCPTSP